MSAARPTARHHWPCALDVGELTRCALAIENRRAQHWEDLLLLPTQLALSLPMTGAVDRGTCRRRRETHRSLEMGAFDGMTYSNTLILERCCGWNVTLIEGNPTNFAKLKTSVRTGAKIHAAVCSNVSTMTFSSRGGVWAGARASMPKANEKMTKGVDVPVPCAPLGTLLNEVGTGDGVSFFSLDVEGAEELVLSTIDPAIFQMILIETHNLSPATNSRIAERLKQHGRLIPSTSVRVKASTVFLREGLRGVPISGVKFWPKPVLPTMEQISTALQEVWTLYGAGGGCRRDLPRRS